MPAFSLPGARELTNNLENVTTTVSSSVFIAVIIIHIHMYGTTRGFSSDIPAWREVEGRSTGSVRGQ